MSARCLWRDVHVYDAATQNYLGGVCQAASITCTTFNRMLHILLVTTDDFSIRQKSTGNIVTPSKDLIIPKIMRLSVRVKFSYMSPTFPLTFHLDAIGVTEEPWYFPSFSSPGYKSDFRDGVSERDGKCMITGGGDLLAKSRIWAQLRAAHVFPLECEDLWDKLGYSKWVTNMDGSTGVSKINSIQNGLLMRRDLHSLFNQYLFSINPDVCTLFFFFFSLVLDILTY